MQSSLKKTLYLGLAAISLGAAAGFSTPAQAASKAKVTSDKVLTTKAETRNINLTGANAIYSKPGTVKGAKLVATTQTAKNLKDSTSSHKNFRAYRVATTNRGSVYYKVVSFDKHSYRGWVYGGKSTSAFAGGLTSYDTFKLGTVTDDQKNGTFKLKNAGTGLDGVTYTQPAWTQYKVGRAILDTTAYKDATFSVDQAGSRTREGDQWVHIKNQNTKDTKADGWILASNLTQTNALNEATQIKVNIVDLSGKTIKSFNQDVQTNAKGAIVKDGVLYDHNGVTTAPTTLSTTFAATVKKALDGTGYAVSATDTVNLNSKVAAGSTLTLYAKKGDQVVTAIKAYKDEGTKEATPLIKATDDAVAKKFATTVVMPTLTKPFSGTNGVNYTGADVQANLASNNASTLSTKTFYMVKGATLEQALDDANVSATKQEAEVTPRDNGKSAPSAVDTPLKDTPYHVEYKFARAFDGVFGAKDDNHATVSATAIYTATLVPGNSAYDKPATSTNSGWAN
ncbi:hypothetical protein [Levilactobacillus spicheri]|uniref:S-layer protein n=2 Tax=Levilactobacillus spicheri TaxID=216463 RepID=A0ABQ0WPM7_9LACO|nr:hypothetical protein [Levilactobacillus spicheri]KRL47063.1 surface layer protein slpb [Levilactobacillus spicheri DSM 15429]GEO67023.1 hypothetical protein LSP04_14420 [Levilactobacillus spicheri]